MTITSTVPLAFVERLLAHLARRMRTIAVLAFVGSGLRISEIGQLHVEEIHPPRDALAAASVQAAQVAHPAQFRSSALR